MGVGSVAYKLEFISILLGVHSVFHVSMQKKYHKDGNYIISWDYKLFYKELSYEGKPSAILD